MARWVIVANNVKSNFSVVDTTNNKVYGPFLDGQLGSEGGGRFDAAVTPDGRTALISNFGDATVFLVDMSDPIRPSLITSVTLPFFAEDIDISADSHYALVADGGFSSRLVTIDIPAATLVYTAELGSASAQGVVIGPDGTIVVPDYFGQSIHTMILGETGEVINTGNTYTYTYPGVPVTDTEYALRPVNLGLSPDGQTLIVCSTTTTTVGIYQVVAPGVLSFTGVITGLEGAYDYYDFGPGTVPHGAVQSVAFNAAGDKAYAVVNDLFTPGTTITNPIVDVQKIGVLNITGPGEVSLDAGGVVTLPHHGSSQLFGVDVIAIAGNKAFVGYPTISGAPDPETRETSLAVVDLTDYSMTTTMVLSGEESIPLGVATVPLHLDLHVAVSDPTPLPGQLVTYTLVLANAGPQITGITLRDALSPGVEFAGSTTLSARRAEVVSTSQSELIITNLVIPAHEQITITLPARVDAMLPTTVITNTAQADSPQLSTPATAQVTVTVAPLPAAVAGAPQTVLSGAKVTLDGSGSVGRKPLTYGWKQIGGMVVTLSGASNVTATFAAPLITQTQLLTFTLTVTDTRSLSSAPDVIVITVAPLPAAVAGAPQTVLSGAKVTLDGSSSVGQTPLTYGWKQIGGMAVTLSGASNVTATFAAPLITQTQLLTFTLTVTDKQNLSSEPSIVAITVEPYRVRLPIVLK